ncbi:MAG: carboxypeptidase regulatory-like domain-containing protein [Marinilabiliaceae bacterium]|nr:carboxypeptidase regulatory-like domain-containing protein [Marinilabiliaceae bacterium]
MKKFLILTGALLLLLSMTYAQVSNITNPNAKKAGVSLLQVQGGSTFGAIDRTTQVNEDPELAEKMKAESQQQQTATSNVSNLSVGSHAKDVKALQQQQQEDLKRAEEEKLLKRTADFCAAIIPAGTTYQVSGTIIDNELGVGIEGVSVTLTGYDNFSTVTDNNGDYIFPLVWDTHTYTITASKPRFTTYTGDVTVNGGDEVYDITLYELLYPPTNVFATEVGTDVVISWEQTGPLTSCWLNYCLSDEVVGRIGYSETSGEDMTMAIRFTPEDFANMYLFDGEITKVALGIGTHMSDVTTMEIRIWEGGTGINDPGTLVYIEPITNFTTFAEETMVEINLTTPWQIDPSKELRIGWNLVNTLGYPFGRDAGPAVAPGKADLLICPALNSGNWVSYLAQYGWNNNISIKAFVSDGSKEVELARGLESYNVYRFKQGEPESAWTLVATALNATTFTDTQWDVLPSGIYNWAVKAVYTGGGLSEAAISFIHLCNGMHEISIGSGTNVLKAPVEVYWRRSFSQTIYTPAELGINGGEISQLTYTFVAPAASANIVAIPITVWIAETDQETLSSTNWIPFSEFTEVFNGTLDWSAAGTYEVVFMLDVPYQYTGSGNLVIYTQRHDSGYATLYHGFYGKNSGYPGKTIISYSDTNPPNPASPSTLGTNMVINGFPNVNILISTTGMGQIEGIVTNTKGQIVPNAKLTIDNMTQITDVDGYYYFPSLQPGNYDIDVTAFGHYHFAELGVVVAADTKTTCNMLIGTFPEVVVTGTVTANDGTGPLANVEVTLIGYQNYGPVYTNDSGVYIFPAVYANNSYQLNAKLTGWENYNCTLIVDTTDPTVYDIMLPLKTYKPSNVVADRASDCSEVVITWEPPVPALPSPVQYILDDGTFEFAMSINPGFNISLGNIFEVGESGEVTSVELLFESYIKGPLDKTLIADIYDVNRNLVGSSEPFLTFPYFWFEVPLPNVPYTGTFYAMLRWDGSINAHSCWFGLDQNGPNVSSNPAWTLNDGTWEPSNTSGWFTAPSVWMIRVNAISEGKSVKYGYAPTKVISNYQVDRLEYGDEDFPSLWTTIATVADDVFTITDNEFGDLPTGGYRYAVRAIHTGNVLSVPAFSDIVWTCDMESTVTITILTNAGDDPVDGTQVTLTQEDGDHIYVATANGTTLFFDDVWKGTYTITATLEYHLPFIATGVTIWDHEFDFTINLVEITDEPFCLEVYPDDDTCSALFTWNNQCWFPQYYQYDQADWFWATRFTAGTEGWKGNKFPVGVTGEVTSVEIGLVDDGPGLPVTVDIFDSNHQLLGSSPTFPMENGWSYAEFLTPVEFNGDFYAMVHWPAGGLNSPFLFAEVDGPFASAGLAWSVDAAGVWQEAHVGTTYPPSVLFVRVHANAENGDKVVYGTEKSFLGYNVYLNDNFHVFKTETEWTFTKLNTGTYVASVERVYSSGVSTRVYSDPFIIDCPIEYHPITFDVTDAVTGDPILDADVVFIGENYNQTGYLHSVEAGTYQYLVQKEGYELQTETIVITEPTTIPISLLPETEHTYSVTFVVKDAQGISITDATVTWDGGAGAYFMMGIDPGSYDWVVAKEGCITESGTAVVVDEDIEIPVTLNPESIRGNSLSSIVLYPNPFNNEIIVSNPELVKRIQITNALGQKVKDTILVDRLIDTGVLANGIYFITIESYNGDKVVRKMIKK